MTEHDFIASMQRGIPPIPAPNAPSPIDCTGIVLGNADIAINHPDAVGAAQEQPHG